jgi:hypothetical protein
MSFIKRYPTNERNIKHKNLKILYVSVKLLNSISTNAGKMYGNEGYKEKIGYPPYQLLSHAGIVLSFKKVSLTNFILKRCDGVSIPEGKKVRLVNEGYESKTENVRMSDK